jgi:hypothetical protein
MDAEALIPILALLIPIIAIVMGIGIAFWFVYWDHQKKKLQYEERRLMIEKGMTPPPVFIDEEKKAVTPEQSLRRGLILCFLGVGFGIGYFIAGDMDGGEPGMLLGMAAAIVGALGIANLMFYLIARNRQHENRGQ